MSSQSSRERRTRGGGSGRGGGGGGSRFPSRGGAAGGHGGRREWIPRTASSSSPAVIDASSQQEYCVPVNRVPSDWTGVLPIPDVVNGAARGRQRHLPAVRSRHRRASPTQGQPLQAVAEKRDGNRSSSDLPQLVQEIQEKLTRGGVECMICCDMVRRMAPIWTCSSCYSIFHLSCIKKWAGSPGSAHSLGGQGSWRCPGCQSVQTVAAKDLRYDCFCGKRRDPPNDLYLIPHSCGEPCRKPLDRVGDHPFLPGDESLRCPHLCVLQCHPGPCPPCKAFAPRRSCPCGKETIVRRCSDHKTPLSCGKPCDRLLSCGRHRCKKVCHAGPCDPCKVLITALCFCKKNKERLPCGEITVKGEFKENDGIFSCNLICGRILACGNHICDELCHPGPCGECQYLPHRIKTCPCGKTELMHKRYSCLDPISTCSEVCGKLLSCGIHRCNDKCHEDDCGPCSVPVNQKCRCGSTSRMVKCSKAFEEKDSFVCEKPCGQKKNCGRHRCNERCCPTSSGSIIGLSGTWDPHICQIPCEKKLRCGQHTCQSLCHSGHCPPCLETIFSDLTCACGKTSIPPPLPCGTPYPSCQHPCMVPQPCGHSASHTCHFGDCPPCPILVSKECVGGHVVLRNVPCGSRDIRCNQLCGKTRQCGMHACGRTCHPYPCDPSGEHGPLSDSRAKASCGQTCGAPRRDCRHTCSATCHPSSPCPDTRCEFPITITCSCGRITANVPCGAGGNSGGFNADTVFEATIIQKLPTPLQALETNGKRIPLGQRKLSCDEECAKLERKQVLAEAFGITFPNLDSLHFGEKSAVSDLLNDLLRREPKWIMALEERFKYMVLGKTKGGKNNCKVHVFCPMIKDKRDVLRQMAERWKLAVYAAGWEPKRFLLVQVTSKSRAPARILGSKAGVPITAVNPPAFDPLVDMNPRVVVSFLDLPREADISALVLRFGGECELVWLNDKNALAVFADPARAATALRRLDHGAAYQGAVVLPQNGALPRSLGNVWGCGSKEVVAAASVVSKDDNWWKKAIAPASSSWGESGPSVPAWNVNKAPIPVSMNKWTLLKSESVSNHTVPETVSARDQVNSWTEPRGDSSFTEQGGGVDVVLNYEGNEVDDWEEVCK